MDFTLILLVIALVVVAVLFAVALRGGGRGREARAGEQGQQGQQQAPERTAIAAPQGQSAQGLQGGSSQEALGQDSADQEMRHQEQGQPGRQAADTSDVEPEQVTTTTTTTREVVSPALVRAETAPASVETLRAPGAVSVSGAPNASTTVGASEQAARETVHADDRVIVRGAHVVEGDRMVAADTLPATVTGATGGESAASAGSVRYTADVPPATIVTAPAPRAETAPAGASSPNGATGARTTVGVASATAEGSATPAQTPAALDSAMIAPGTPGAASMELVGQPPTRTGAVMLSVAPQRLPYRLAELLGEQRGLEEAITLAHRRIDDIELGPDPGSTDSRVRLGVLREDLTQKQERLREILFLQDGYRWLQQHMAPDRAPSES